MIHLVGEDARSVPNWFKRRLRDIDTALVVYYNPFRNVFCIDRCIKGSDCLSSDHISCEKSNVHIFPHISEKALDDLKSKDAWTKHGGKDLAAMLRQRMEREQAKAEFDARVSESIAQGFREAALDNKNQLRKAHHLIQQHDTARVHK